MFIDDSDARVLKCFTFFQTQWFQCSGDLASCESVTFPFCHSLVGCDWIFLYLLPSRLLAVPLFSVLAPNPSCRIILSLVIWKWNQPMN